MWSINENKINGFFCLIVAHPFILDFTFLFVIGLYSFIGSIYNIYTIYTLTIINNKVRLTEIQLNSSSTQTVAAAAAADDDVPKWGTALVCGVLPLEQRSNCAA